MAEEGFALTREESLASEGLIHQTKEWNAATRQADQCSPQREAEDEGTGAVDRIDHPAIVGIAPGRAELLANDAVTRTGVCQRFPNRGLRCTVGRGDRIEKIASFMVNREGCPEMRQNDRAGSVGQSVRSREKRLKFGH